MSLRHNRLLPSQLRAAWEIVELQIDDGMLGDAARHALFGGGREFLEERNHVPLVAHIIAAATHRDQHGRYYALADPSGYEPPSLDHPETVLDDPVLHTTDQLFFAISPAVTASSRRADTAAVEALEHPGVDDSLVLTPLLAGHPTCTVAVVERIKPSAENRRVASGLVRIDAQLPTPFFGLAASALAIFNSECARISAEAGPPQ